MLRAAREAEHGRDTSHDSAEPPECDSGGEFAEPRTQRRGVSGNAGHDDDAVSDYHNDSARDPAEANSNSTIARPFKVDEIATDFYEAALPLWRDENWNSAQLFRVFTKRYGQNAVGRSSFYRWVEERLVAGRPPDPLACKPRLEGGAPDGPNPRELVDLDADPPRFQSRVILDLALRLSREEIDLLDAQLSPLKAVSTITLSETALLRAVRARQAHDRSIERDPIWWTI